MMALGTHHKQMFSDPLCCVVLFYFKSFVPKKSVSHWYTASLPSLLAPWTSDLEAWLDVMITSSNSTQNTSLMTYDLSLRCLSFCLPSWDRATAHQKIKFRLLLRPLVDWSHHCWHFSVASVGLSKFPCSESHYWSRAGCVDEAGEIDRVVMWIFKRHSIVTIMNGIPLH